MTGHMDDLQETIAHLKQVRDEIELKIKLGSMEARDEWDELEAKWQKFSSDAELDKTAEGVGTALGLLAKELKEGYHRLKESL